MVHDQLPSMNALIFQHSGTPRALDEGYNHASQIQQKKEELYNLIAKAVAEPTTTWLDRRLLKALSLQIKPRPKDPQWYNINHIYSDIDICYVSLPYQNSYVILTISSNLPVGAR